MNGIDPKVWGPGAWHLLHRLSFKITGQEAIKFYRAIGDLLPCTACRSNFSDHLQLLPIRDKDVSKWVWELHNRVNVAAGHDIQHKYELHAGMFRKSVIESIFLKCLIKTHPGIRRASTQYIESLQTFIQVYCRYSGVHVYPQNYASRSSMMQWLKNI